MNRQQEEIKVQEAIKILTSEIYSDEIAECGVKFKEAFDVAIKALQRINILEDATNGDVLKMLFPPSVYYGDDEKHIVLLTKDCELTCLNNEWWNAPYKAERENKKESK